MNLLHTISGGLPHLPHHKQEEFKEKQYDYDIPSPLLSILDNEPGEVVGIALHTLQRAGVELIEAFTLAYRRLGVPRLIKDFAYVVPDDDIPAASDILSSIGLPRAEHNRLLLRAEGDVHAKGTFHRITKYTTPSSVQHIVLYPSSLINYLPEELESSPPLHNPQSTRVKSILSPLPSAVYSAIIRTMTSYPTHCSTRTVLESDLSELIRYHLYRMEDGTVDPEDEEEWLDAEEDRMMAEAEETVKAWHVDGVWREGEEWIGDALREIVSGRGDVECLPCLPRAKKG